MLEDGCVTNSGIDLFKNVGFLQNTTDSIGGLRPFLQTLDDRRYIQPGLIRPGIVKAEFLQGTPISTRGTGHRHNPVADFTLFAVSL